MVLCSIEEAWGSNFNNLDNQTRHVKKDDNKYRYSFSRDSRPLSEHNGCYRNPNKHNITINNTIGNTQPDKDSPPGHSLGDDDDERFESFESNYDNSSDDTYQPVEEENDFENFEMIDNNESSRNNVYVEDDDNDNDDTFEGQEENEISNDVSDKNEYYNNYQSEDEDNQTGVTVNMSIVLDKLNKLIGNFEDVTKMGNSGLKDIFIFVILGIFLIFIMDLIFRIGQKLTK